MAGEKSKENKTLQSACEVCGNELSVELLRGTMVGAGRSRRIIPVCKPCLDKGWDPDAPPVEESVAS